MEPGSRFDILQAMAGWQERAASVSRTTEWTRAVTRLLRTGRRTPHEPVRPPRGLDEARR